MTSSPASNKRNRWITGILLIDLGYLAMSIVHNDIYIILYSSGLWAGQWVGFMWLFMRCMVLFAAHHFRYPKLFRVLIGFELMVGLLVALTDVWVYYTTNCECMLQIDGAILRLTVRTLVLLGLIRVGYR